MFFVLFVCLFFMSVCLFVCFRYLCSLVCLSQSQMVTFVDSMTFLWFVYRSAMSQLFVSDPDSHS